MSTQAKGHVSGSKDTHKVAFYGLSTCIWCKKTRDFLESQDVAFDYTYVDLLQGQEKKDAIAQVRCWNSSVSFPTIVIDEQQCVVGFKRDNLKELLEL
ncbi:MAG TPA: glutaredoxin family protein [Chloroflexi bacterium]|nr:glutaredoxin family protein [Chloroflexota bacterium]